MVPIRLAAIASVPLVLLGFGPLFIERPDPSIERDYNHYSELMARGERAAVKSDLVEIGIEYYCQYHFQQSTQAEQLWERYERIALIYNSHPKRDVAGVKNTPKFTHILFSRQGATWVKTREICSSYGVYQYI